MSKLLNLEIANTTSQTVAAEDLLTLGTIVRKYCCTNCCGVPTFTYANGTSAVSLNQGGYYYVRVHANASAAAAGVAKLTLNVNGVPVPYATASESISTANTEVRSLSFSTTIRVLPNAPLTITVANGDSAITYSIVDLDIIKIC